MAWIELHQTIARHPKTIRAARRLGAGVPTVVGHLGILWGWCIDYALDGDVSGYNAEELALAAMWDGDPEVFVEALVAAGYLDRDEDGGLYLHDWDDYAGRLIEQIEHNREQARLRQQRRRKRIKEEQAAVARDGHADVTRDMSVSHGPTIPNLTKPNQEHDGAPATYPEDFESFWSAYPGPRKKKKATALKAYRAARKIGVTHESIMAGLERSKRSKDWQKDGGAFIEGPEVWLNAGSYDGEPEPAPGFEPLPELPFKDRPWGAAIARFMPKGPSQSGVLNFAAACGMDSSEALDALRSKGIEGTAEWAWSSRSRDPAA